MINCLKGGYGEKKWCCFFVASASNVDYIPLSGPHCNPLIASLSARHYSLVAVRISSLLGGFPVQLEAWSVVRKPLVHPCKIWPGVTSAISSVEHVSSSEI